MKRRMAWRAAVAVSAGAAAMAGAGAASLWYAMRVERKSVELDRFTLYLDRQGLPPAGAVPKEGVLPPEGLTILHLSDFHFRAGDSVQAAKVARLLELVSREPYDVVALTGDLIHDWSGLPLALDLIGALRPSRATLYCPGNHDYAEYSMWGMPGHTQGSAGEVVDAPFRSVCRAVDRGQGLLRYVRRVAANELVRVPIAFNDMPALFAELEACGVEVLVNRSTRLRVGGADVWFAGVDDALEGQPDLGEALADVPGAATLVLLAHNPDIWLDPQVERADLVLSGHTHGGQIRMPLIGAAHTQGTHLTRRKAAGWFQRGSTSMFVSRGLGESIPLRFRAGPQAALIRLLPKNRDSIEPTR